MRSTRESSAPNTACCTRTRGEIWLLSAGRAVRDESGRPVRITGIAVDISERKRS